MKTFTRMTALILAMALCLSLFTGCSKSKQDTATTETTTTTATDTTTDATADTTTDTSTDTTADTEVQPETEAEVAEATDTAEEKTVTGTISDIKDFMFTVTTEDDKIYDFSFEGAKPEGLDTVAEGDKVNVTYTGALSEVDSFNGTIVSVSKAE